METREEIDAMRRELELRRELDELRAEREYSAGSLPPVGRYGMDVNIGQARKGKGKIVVAYAMYVSGFLIIFTGHELSAPLGVGIMGLGYFVQTFGEVERWWHWK